MSLSPPLTHPPTPPPCSQPALCIHPRPLPQHSLSTPPFPLPTHPLPAGLAFAPPFDVPPCEQAGVERRSCLCHSRFVPRHAATAAAIPQQLHLADARIRLPHGLPQRGEAPSSPPWAAPASRPSASIASRQDDRDANGSTLGRSVVIAGQAYRAAHKPHKNLPLRFCAAPPPPPGPRQPIVYRHRSPEKVDAAASRTLHGACLLLALIAAATAGRQADGGNSFGVRLDGVLGQRHQAVTQHTPTPPPLRQSEGTVDAHFYILSRASVAANWV